MGARECENWESFAVYLQKQEKRIKLLFPITDIATAMNDIYNAYITINNKATPQCSSFICDTLILNLTYSCWTHCFDGGEDMP